MEHLRYFYHTSDFLEISKLCKMLYKTWYLYFMDLQLYFRYVRLRLTQQDITSNI